MTKEHECIYSKSMEQPYPRLCIICGKEEIKKKTCIECGKEMKDMGEFQPPYCKECFDRMHEENLKEENIKK